ncbi:MAG: hydroxyethylthiazole kinase [Lachnospiraceae bacterium]|nr:hydroxyethylthiazole kinase [Lachnospiraceae bacterium]
MEKQKIGLLVNEVRKKVPLVHNITNYVTVNDCANAILAIGASPIMADDSAEAADITAISKALVLNIGTLNKRTVESMIISGKKANELGIPVIFDPVGAGASAFRNETTQKILKEVKIAIIRANLSEMSYIAGLEVSTKGVDASEADANHDATKVAKTVAGTYDCVAAITGAIDVISDGTQVVRLSNGVSLLSKVTGTGCMTSALVGAFAGAASESEDFSYLHAACAGIASMSIAGELAFEKSAEQGTGSFHISIIDYLSKMDDKIMNERIKIETE